MWFLGEGRVEGQLDYMSIGFEGVKDGGQGTRTAVPVGETRRMLEGFSEREYVRVRVGRW